MFYNLSNPFYLAFTPDVDPTKEALQMTLPNGSLQISCPVGYSVGLIKSSFNILDPFYTCSSSSEVNSFRIGCGDTGYFINSQNQISDSSQLGKTCQPIIVSPLDNSTLTATNQTGYIYQTFDDGNIYCLPKTTTKTCPSLDYPSTLQTTYLYYDSNQFSEAVFNCVNNITCSDLTFTQSNEYNPSLSYEENFPYKSSSACSTNSCSPFRISTPFVSNLCNGKQSCNPFLDLTENGTLNHGPFPCDSSVSPTSCSQYIEALYTQCSNYSETIPAYCKLPKVLGATWSSAPTENCDGGTLGLTNILHGYSVNGLYRCIPNSEFSFSRMMKNLF